MKGPSAVALGLRPDRISTDVDVWIRPRDLRVLTARLEHLGWRERPLDRIDDIFPVHSLTFYHASWGCDIDVHFTFPGCDGEPDAVFDVLMQHTIELPLAHVQVTTLDAIAHAIVIALHGLRTPWEPRNQRELSFLIDAIDRVQVPAMYACAEAMGCLPALAPFFRALDADRYARTDFGRPSSDWMIRTTARTSGSIRLINVINAPWRQKPHLVKLALFPSVEALRSVDLFLPVEHPSDLRLARRRRLIAGIRRVPTMFADLYRHYRKSHSGD
ncbi:nucleotidyltransferase family protein [Microbacteriaceae bacterium VKM Ac-2855]|nr:nucleotidyltransferase family protein [Microbacteriaceae bacterium VKM Ac-2855]